MTLMAFETITPEAARHEAVLKLLNAVLVRLDRIDETMRAEANRP